MSGCIGQQPFKGNEAELTAVAVRHCFQGLLGAMARWKSLAGSLADDIDHFLKVSRSYWPGLFHCYDIQNLPSNL